MTAMACVQDAGSASRARTVPVAVIRQADAVRRARRPPASRPARHRPVRHLTSGISRVERWFAELQRRCLDRGVFCSLDELTTALEDWIKIWNASARPFTWTKTADQIIDRICRYCSRISGPGH